MKESLRRNASSWTLTNTATDDYRRATTSEGNGNGRGRGHPSILTGDATAAPGVYVTTSALDLSHPTVLDKPTAPSAAATHSLGRALHVLLVATPPIMQFGVAHALASEPDIKLIKNVGDASRAADEAAQAKPDVVLLYSEGSVGDALQTVAAIQAAAPDARILLLAEADDEWSVLSALRGGVSGYGVRGTVWPEDVRAAIQAIARGCQWVCPTITRRLISSLSERASGPPSRSKCPYGLSDRELEILLLVAEGARNADVAERLVLSLNTVKTYLRRIMEKLEAHTRQEAVAKAIRAGVIPERRQLPRGDSPINGNGGADNEQKPRAPYASSTTAVVAAH